MIKKIVLFSYLGLLVTFGFSQSDELVYNDLSLALTNPDSVFVLDLSNKGLETLPAAVVRFRNLKRLNLASNNISKLPYYIAELENLEFLDISKMPMLNLNDALEKISQMQNLKNLEISESGGKILKINSTNNYKIHNLIISSNGNI